MGEAYLCEILGKSKIVVIESQANVASGWAMGKWEGTAKGHKGTFWAVAMWTAVWQAALVQAQSPVHLKLAYFIVRKLYLEKADSPQN